MSRLKGREIGNTGNTNQPEIVNNRVRAQVRDRDREHILTFFLLFSIFLLVDS